MHGEHRDEITTVTIRLEIRAERPIDGRTEARSRDKLAEFGAFASIKYTMTESLARQGMTHKNVSCYNVSCTKDYPEVSSKGILHTKRGHTTVLKNKLASEPPSAATVEGYSFEPGDSDFDLRVLRALRRIMRAVDVYSRKLIAEYGITGPQLACLSHIVKGEGVTLSRLSRGMYMSPSTVNGILDRLEIKHLIQRERKDRDRRKVIITATSKGREVAAHAPSSLQDKLANAMLRLPEDEQVALTASIERIVDLMEIGYLDSSPILAKELKPAEEKERS